MPSQSDIQTLSSAQLAAYLESLDISKESILERNNQEQVLALLHRAHTLHIPFSTLSFHQGAMQSDVQPYIPQEITLEHAYKKLIVDRLGGTCVSLNLLFTSLLKSLNFEIYSHRAHVMWGSEAKKPVATHRFSTVKIGTAIFLIDVGFGGPGPRDLLTIFNSQGNLNTSVQGSGLFQFQFEQDSDGHIVLYKVNSNKRQSVYSFDLKITVSEKEYANPSPEVIKGINEFIIQNLFTTKPYKEGRLMLLNQMLSFQATDEKSFIETKIEIPSHKLYDESLGRFFGLSYQGTQFKGLGKPFNEQKITEYRIKHSLNEATNIEHEQIPAEELDINKLHTKMSF